MAAVLPISLAVTAAPASAAAHMAAPPKVTIAVAGDQATISQATMRPGVVEFQVGKTFKVPGPQGGPDTLSIVRTDQLDEVLAALGPVFAEDFADPASMAAAARGMAAARSMSTWYGGTKKGGVWQVDLPAGNYYVIGLQSTMMGLAKPVAFTVAGEPRSAPLHATAGTIRAISVPGGNAFVAKGMSHLGDGWVKFANSAKEVHFMSMTGVKPSTDAATIRKAFQSNSDPKWIIGPHYDFDVISPGVSVAMQGPFGAGRYLVDCFIPSETDGMPHALMGMWKLVDVG